MAKLAPVVPPFLNPLEVDHGTPVACPNLGGRPSDGILCPVHTGFLWRGQGDFFSTVVHWTSVPLVLFLPELLGYLELEKGK